MKDRRQQEQEPASIHRRALLRGLLASASALGVSGWTTRTVREPGPVLKPMQRLVLVELAGGNDGLNTVVPYSQERYYKARPVLAMARDQLHKLDDNLGLHPELEPLMEVWRTHDLHIALGVGYPNPNRSHFRSIDIWNTASGSDKVLEHGWLANAFSQRPLTSEGIVFGGDFGPLLGSERSLILDRPEQFIRQAQQVKKVAMAGDNPALAHVVRVRQQVSAASRELATALADVEMRKYKSGSALHRQLHLISDLIAADINVPVLKATLKGFDTHFYQPNRHKKLMTDLGMALAALRERLISSGNWRNTIIMTYSEFGRRPAENGSRGTDHGTAAPVLIAGGKVRGGFSAQQPVLPKNPEQDLEFALDYRSLYRTVAEDWLGAQPRHVDLRTFEKLDLFG